MKGPTTSGPGSMTVQQTITPSFEYLYSALFASDEEDEISDLIAQLRPLLDLRGGRGPQRYTDPQLCLWASLLGILDARGETSTQVAARLGSTDETIRRQRRRVDGRQVRKDHIPLPPIDYSIQ